MEVFSSIPAPFPMSCKTSSNTEGDALKEDKVMEGGEQEDMQVDKDTPMVEKEGVKNMDSDGQSMSDESDSSLGGSAREILAAVKSYKEEGSTLLKDGQMDEALKMYKLGLRRLKKITCNEEVSQSEVDQLKLALYLNRSLVHFRQCEWSETIKACSEALAFEPNNVKGLFRRGTARSRHGFLNEARADLLLVCQLAPSNVEARSELKRVNEKLIEARNRDRKAYHGLFNRSGGLYKDREKQMEERKKRQAEELKREKEEYQQECKRREAAGEPQLPSFEIWKKERSEAQQKEDSPMTTQSKPVISNNSTIGANDLDEEDRKIMEETKKMGYCYFNRPVNEEVKKEYTARTQPVKVREVNAPNSGAGAEEPSKCSLSSWNNKGTTYEEKDCSTWCCNQLKELLSQINIKNDPLFNAEQIQRAVQCLRESCDKKETKHIEESLAKAFPFSCKVESVDTVEGDAQIVVLRSSKRYLYDIKVVLSFTVTIPDPLRVDEPPAQYSGSLHVEDISSASSHRETLDSKNNRQADWLCDARVVLDKKCKGLSPLHQQVWNHAVTQLKEQLHEQIKTFDAAFHQYA